MLLTPSTRGSAFARTLVITLVALAIVIAWDFSGLDVAFAHLAGGTPNGFPLRDNWFASNILHEDARRLGWLVALWLCIGVGWPTWILQKLDMQERIELPIVVLLSLLCVFSIKSFSHTSCPWDLKEFGGVATYVSHWAIGVRDGGTGGCFPAGHATAGFSFLGGYFVWRRRYPRIAKVWVSVALVVGFFLGFVQQVRGAHYMSHTLWSGWICWTSAWIIDLIWQKSKHLFTIQREPRMQE